MGVKKERWLAITLRKPGRPSHTFFMANLGLILDVEVQAGNEMSAHYTSVFVVTKT